MGNDARARSVRYTVKKTSASSSASHDTRARLEKKSPTALKNEEKESPRDANGTLLPWHAEREDERRGDRRKDSRAQEAEAGIDVVERKPHQRSRGVPGEPERRDDR